MVNTKLVFQVLSVFTFFIIVYNASFCFAEIYSWEDEKGNKYYTDEINTIPEKYRDKLKLIFKSKPKTGESHNYEKEELNKKIEEKAIDNHKTIIPLHQSGTALIVSAELNGFEPALFMVDTGATFTTVSQEVAAKLNINNTKNLPSLSLQTANGIVEAPLIKLKYIRVGEVEQNDVMAVIIDAVPGYTGLLGLTFLNEFNYSINPVDKILILESLESSSKDNFFGGHGRKWWQRKFRLIRGIIQKEKKEMGKFKILKTRTAEKRKLSLIEKRIAKSQINLNYFQKELKILDHKATLSMVPIMWRQ